MSPIRLFAAMFAACFLLTPLAAAADNWHRGHDRGSGRSAYTERYARDNNYRGGYGQPYGNSYGNAYGNTYGGSRTVTIDRGQRVVIRDYFEHPAYGRCASGFVWRNNNCLPLTQYRYGVGQILPVNYVVYAVPQPVHQRLRPPPRGCRYVMNGGDILLVSERERLIIDIVSLFDNFAR